MPPRPNSGQPRTGARGSTSLLPSTLRTNRVLPSIHPRPILTSTHRSIHPYTHASIYAYNTSITRTVHTHTRTHTMHTHMHAHAGYCNAKSFEWSSGLLPDAHLHLQCSSAVTVRPGQSRSSFCQQQDGQPGKRIRVNATSDDHCTAPDDDADEAVQLLAGGAG